MRYRWLCSRGLFTGSGVVEVGCKSIAGQRLRQAGMHRTTDGAGAIIALRCAEASSQREAISFRLLRWIANRPEPPSPGASRPSPDTK